MSCGRLPCQDALRVTVVLCTSAIPPLLAFSLGHHPAHNFLLKCRGCHFAQAIGVTSDPKITFPYLLKIRASTPGLCATPAGSRSATAQSLEDPINLVARRSIPHHQRRRLDQTLSHRSRAGSRYFVHWCFSYACRRRVRIGSSCRRPKSFTKPDACNAARPAYSVTASA